MYLLQLIQQSPLSAFVFLIALVAAVTVHEFAHAWTADRLGDDTPRLQGRVTLNPAAHLDPIGSLLFLVAGFGWGKPVIYNPMRLSRHSDELLIALAGPISNILLAIVFNAIAYSMTYFGATGFDPEIFKLAAYINVILAAFNMIPIPPLDGSAIIAYFWPEYRSLMGGQIGVVVLLLLILTGSLSLIVQPIAGAFSQFASLFGILG